MDAGHEPSAQAFPHHLQYAPWLLKPVPAPQDTVVTIANTWSAFSFLRPRTKLIAIEHLFVLDPAAAPYKSRSQAIFHNYLIKAFENATYRAADCVVAVSEYTAMAYAEGLGVPKPRVIHNGIDTTFFSPDASSRSNSSNADRPFRLLFVGNLTRRKGADLLPEIMHRLGDQFELSYTSGFRTAYSFYHLANTRKLGRLDQDALREEYRRADALLFPTRLEGLPLVAIESMACGTPVVASHAASLPEVITHARNGLLCPPNDPEGFAAAILQLRDNPEFLDKLAANARSCAEERFSSRRMRRDYDLLIAEIVG
jgi:glycosyltransferase involved in cell wall biosynthesis